MKTPVSKDSFPPHPRLPTWLDDFASGNSLRGQMVTFLIHANVHTCNYGNGVKDVALCALSNKVNRPAGSLSVFLSSRFHHFTGRSSDVYVYKHTTLVRVNPDYRGRRWFGSRKQLLGFQPPRHGGGVDSSSIWVEIFGSGARKWRKLQKDKLGHREGRWCQRDKNN